jgi:hypothetical protein
MRDLVIFETHGRLVSDAVRDAKRFQLPEPTKETIVEPL